MYTNDVLTLRFSADAARALSSFEGHRTTEGQQRKLQLSVATAMMTGGAAGHSYSFRLDAGDSSSSYSDSGSSHYNKQRIDSLFQRSLPPRMLSSADSDYETIETASSLQQQQQRDSDSSKQAVTNGSAVRVGAAAETGAAEPSKPSAAMPVESWPAAQHPGMESVMSPAAIVTRLERQGHTPPQLSNAIFKVDYMGAVQVEEGATQLEDLQGPLKRLYMQYRAPHIKHEPTPQDSLEITETGILVRYSREMQKSSWKVGSKTAPDGRHEVFNPFSTIAVWAAVKFVATKVQSVEAAGRSQLQFAFLPLICDPESPERSELYSPLEPELNSRALGVRHPPLLACLMRPPGLLNNLQCHGFVCAAPEDAIVIAANLYQSLLTRLKPAGSAAPSTAAAEVNSGPESASNAADTSDAPTRPRRRRAPPPPDPLRRSARRQSVRSRSASRERREAVTAASSSDDAGLTTEGGSTFRRAGDQQWGSQRRSFRDRCSAELTGRRVSHQQRNSTGEGLADPKDSRRCRSSSETTVSGRWGGQLSRSVSDSRGGGTAERSVSPPDRDHHRREHTEPSQQHGKVEPDPEVNIRKLLADLQQRDGIKTVDDILRHVIGPHGMSFSELQSEHRELLLRLALTLSRDEMYKRSKSILKKQTKKVTVTSGESDTDGSSIGSVLRATKRSLSKLASKSGGLPAASAFLRNHSPLSRFYGLKSRDNKKSHSKDAIGELLSEHKLSKSSKASRPTNSSGDNPNDRDAKGLSPDTRKGRHLQPSCGAQRCRRHLVGCASDQRRSGGTLSKARSLRDIAACNCDDQDCADSDRCYCSLRRATAASCSNLENIQLEYGEARRGDLGGSGQHLSQSPPRRQQAGVFTLSRAGSANDVTLSRTDSANDITLSRPEASKRGDGLRRSRRDFKRDSGRGSRRRVSVTQQQPNESSANASSCAKGTLQKSGSVDTLETIRLSSSSCSQPRTHEPAGPGRLGSSTSLSAASSSLSASSNHSCGSRFLLMSAADPSGRVVSSRGGSQRRRQRGDSDLLALKKTTEIAAEFSGLRLSQTTDLLSSDEAESDHGASTRRFFSGHNIENSLGYLP